MVCGTEGQAAIAAFTNETPTKVTTPTWNNDTSTRATTCTRRARWASRSRSSPPRPRPTRTTTSLQKQFGVKQKFELGQGAFVAPDGKVVTRKDYKVLTVDPTTLPAKFGQPPTTRANIAIGAASALMGCWTGA